MSSLTIIGDLDSFGHISVQTQCVNYRMLTLLPSDHVFAIPSEPTFKTACCLAELSKYVTWKGWEVGCARLSSVIVRIPSPGSLMGVPFGFCKKGGIVMHAGELFWNSWIDCRIQFIGLFGTVKHFTSCYRPSWAAEVFLYLGNELKITDISTWRKLTDRPTEWLVD